MAVEARCARRIRGVHAREAAAMAGFLARARVSLGMQRAPIRRYTRAVVERPFEGQGSRLSPSADIYIYATHRPRCLYYLYRIAVDPDASVPALPLAWRDRDHARVRLADERTTKFFPFFWNR